MLLSRRVRPAGRRAPHRGNCPRRQSQVAVPHLLDLQDRRRSGGTFDGAHPRHADRHRAPERAVRQLRRLAVLSHGDAAEWRSDPGSTRRAGALQPHPRGRHHHHSAQAARRRVSTATTVNWCGEQEVSLQEWASYIGSLVEREPVFEESLQALRGGPTDATRMRELTGGTTVDWRDGIRRMVTTFHPELVR